MQLDLNLECQYSEKAVSTAYTYGCRCPRCRKWSRERYRAAPASANRTTFYSRIKKTYGLKPNEYDALLAAQDGVCAICRCLCSSGKYLAVDHDHKTGRGRGLLCGNCNLGLGHFKDSSETLNSAMEYLKGRDTDA